jgi:hypothetical protein
MKSKVFIVLTGCHPGRPHHAKGLCKECYFLEYRKSPKYQEYLKSGRLTVVQKRYRATPHAVERIKRYRQSALVRDRSAAYFRKQKYGVTDEWYNELLLNQDGRCAICYADDCALEIDHCHGTGKVRGLLCHHCNAGLGHFKDSVHSLKNAIKFISI